MYALQLIEFRGQIPVTGLTAVYCTYPAPAHGSTASPFTDAPAPVIPLQLAAAESPPTVISKEETAVRHAQPWAAYAQAWVATIQDCISRAQAWAVSTQGCATHAHVWVVTTQACATQTQACAKQTLTDGVRNTQSSSQIQVVSALPPGSAYR